MQHWCDGCLDVLLKSFFQIFNPNVETGPCRLTNRHAYDDGIMPDYPAVGRYRNRRMDPAKTPYDDVATTDYSEGGGSYGPVNPFGKRSKAGKSGVETAEPVADYVNDNGGCGVPVGPFRKRVDSGKSGRVSNGGAGGVKISPNSLTDFIISLLETVQLTSRATLKRSFKKNATAATRKSISGYSTRHPLSYRKPAPS